MNDHEPTSQPSPPARPSGPPPNEAPPFPHATSVAARTQSAAVLHDTPFLCAACNYPLRQLTEYRCPECGKAFDPHDITTVNAGKPLTAFARRMIKPVGWWFIAWVMLLALATFVAASGPTSYWNWMIRCFYLWGFTGIWLVMRFFVAMVIHARRHQPIFLHQRKWLFWLAAPAIAGITFLLLEFGVPFRVAFHFSRPQLDQFAIEALANPDQKFSDQWIGAFPARDIKVQNSQVNFLVRGTESITHSGLMYSTAFAENSGDHRGLTHAGGNWYIWQKLRMSLR